jgi:succinoglycan biosynthesis transport protein ExoP
LDVKRYVGVPAARWRLVLVSVLVGTAVAAWVASSLTSTYAARTQLFVSTEGVPADPSQTYQGGLFSQQRVLSYAPIVSSPAVAKAVIEQLRLPYGIRQLQQEIHASVPADTVLMDVTVKDRSPRRAKAIADAVGQQFPRFVDTLEAPSGGKSSPVRVSVASQARIPTSPVSPQKGVYVALGGLVGLLLGIGAAVALEAVDSRVKIEDDVAGMVGAPVLASIADDSRAGRRPLVVLHDPFSVQAEAYRRLRTNLRVLSVDRDLRSVVVSSAVASEGKTVTVANLGISLAQAGYTVVLVDADLRAPNLAAVLGLSPHVGLTDVLVDDFPLRQALQAWSDGLPLEVLASGRQPPNPSELLGSQRFASVLDSLTERADLVILDAPALLPVTDAAILARVTSGLILVTRVRSTRTQQVQTATETLRAVDEGVLGVVLNRSRVRGAWRLRASYPPFARDMKVGAAADRPLDVPS